MGLDLEPKADTLEGIACGTGEEESLGASGSSGAGRRINSLGGELKQEQHSIFLNLKGKESRVQHSLCSGIGTPPPNNE